MAVTGCSDPHVAWLAGSRRIIVVADDPPNGSISGAVWDASLTPITPPTTLAPSAHWARISGDADAASIAWVENDSVQKVRSARLADDGRVTMMNAAVGELDATLGPRVGHRHRPRVGHRHRHRVESVTVTGTCPTAGTAPSGIVPTGNGQRNFELVGNMVGWLV